MLNYVGKRPHSLFNMPITSAVQLPTRDGTKLPTLDGTKQWSSDRSKRSASDVKSNMSFVLCDFGVLPRPLKTRRLLQPGQAPSSQVDPVAEVQTRRRGYAFDSAEFSNSSQDFSASLLNDTNGLFDSVLLV